MADALMAHKLSPRALLPARSWARAEGTLEKALSQPTSPQGTTIKLPPGVKRELGTGTKSRGSKIEKVTFFCFSQVLL